MLVYRLFREVTLHSRAVDQHILINLYNLHEDIYIYIYIYTSNNQECLGYMSAFYLTDLFHEDKCCHSISRNTSRVLVQSACVSAD